MQSPDGALSATLGGAEPRGDDEDAAAIAREELARERRRRTPHPDAARAGDGGRGDDQDKDARRSRNNMSYFCKIFALCVPRWCL